MLDGYRLARLQGVRVIGELLRRRWGLWCGLLVNGRALPIGEAGAAVDLPVCVQLMTRGDESGSCAGSNRRWSAAARDGNLPPEEISELRCHAGLATLLRPVHLGGDLYGTFYVSGYWPQHAGDDDAHYLHKRLRALSLEPSGQATAKITRLGPEDRAQIEVLIEAACAEMRQYAHSQRRPEVVRPQGRYGDIIGQSTPVLDLFRILDKVADSESTVLIQGENGTGKELIARAVHYNSRRLEGPFVVQNCSALNDNLLDSELFGHKKGAFTGAVTDKQGLFEIANGGTFFLDEVGDMSPTLQVKMLRVLQEGTFLPVGDTVVRRVDVRIIAATNRDLKSMVREGTFREDLYYRLNVINIVVPPLRERKEDIELLVQHFLRRAERQMDIVPARMSQALKHRPDVYRRLPNKCAQLNDLGWQG